MTDECIFVMIAVHDPGGDLPALPGAINSAKRMIKWAERNHYITKEFLDDGGKKVTVEKIQEELGKLINKTLKTKNIKRLVVYFIGHGLEDFWLLSDWKKNPGEAIHIPSSLAILEYYHPVQVSFFGDACREINSDIALVLGNSILLVPEDEEPSEFERNTFYSARTGKKAYMIPASGTSKAFCLYTELVLEAFEGSYESALEIDKDKLTATLTDASLTQYLKSQIPIKADEYGVTMEPRSFPGFSTDKVYKQFQMETQTYQIEKSAREPRRVFKPNPGLTTNGMYFPPEDDYLNEGYLSVTRTEITSNRVTKEYEFQRLENSGEEASNLEMKLGKQEKSAVEKSNQWLQGDAQTKFESNCGVSIFGNKVTDVTSLQTHKVEAADTNHSYRVWLNDVYIEPDKYKFSDILVDFGGNELSLICAVSRFTARLATDIQGRSSLVYLPTKSDIDHKPHVKKVLDAIAKIDSIDLSFDEAAELAANIRYLKHVDLTLGCLATYLYNKIGDIDGIRKTAYYYPKNNQPVPIDIAILSRGLIKNSGGHLTVDLPATIARDPRPFEEELNYTTNATDELKGVKIAGIMPWMKQGWLMARGAFVDDSAKDWRKQLGKISIYVKNSPFTVIDKSAMPEIEELYETFRMIT